jgi:hypothetical protein
MSLTKRSNPRGQRPSSRRPEGVADVLARVKREQEQGRWVVGCGGSEVPFEYWGTRWLYVFQPSSGRHGYLNLDTDVVHDDYRTEVV